MDYQQAALDMYLRHKGVISVSPKVSVSSRELLSTAYTPGVAEPCREIARDVSKVYDYTGKGNSLAVITDGSAVLGLGNIGPEAGLPVMEGKCLLFNSFAGIDAFPLCLASQNVDEIVSTVACLAPGLGGINLEDISAPRCFEIERQLQEMLDIPVFHDDQHGTAVVVLAGLINAVKLRSGPLCPTKSDISPCPVLRKATEGRQGRDFLDSFSSLRIVIAGAGAAGVAIARLLRVYGAEDIVLVDSKGIVSLSRDSLTDYKRDFAVDAEGDLSAAVDGADVFIGVSKPNILSEQMIRSMAPDPIVFAMSNPDPEVAVDVAMAAGVRLMATGRSDYPNQLNNVLVFPGVMRAAMQKREQVSDEMKIAAAVALAGIVEEPTPERFIPYALEVGVADVVTKACFDAV